MTATPGYPTVALPTVAAQPVMSAYFEYDLSSVTNQIVATDGTTKNLKAAAVVAKVINLPQLAEVIGGELDVRTVSNESGTATLAIGDSASATRYLSATSIKSQARTAIVPTGFVGAGEGIQITLANQNGDATAGVIRVRVEYIISGRASEVNSY